MTAMPLDAEFIDYLNMVGSDFSLIQGLGGNGSVKSGDVMLVKASGKRLSDASSPNYFYKVGLSNGEYRETNSNQAGRPSIEVFLHAMLPHKYVVHLHSSKAVALSMLLPNNPSLRVEVQSQGILVIPYTKPGLELREAIKTQMPEYTDTSASISILLQNHGSIFAANSVQELSYAVRRFEAQAISLLGGGLGLAINPDNLDLNLDAQELSHIQWHAAKNWRIAPDHVVFLGAEAPRALLREVHGPTKLADLLQVVSPSMKLVGPREEQLLWFIDVVQHLPKLTLETISKNDAVSLISWESEKSRIVSAMEEYGSSAQ